MGRCVEKLPHSCGSGDGLQVFEGSKKGEYNGYCFACSTFVPDPYQDKPKGYKPPRFMKSAEQVAQELEEIDGYQVLDVTSRKLKAKTLEHFGVKVSTSETDGKTPTAMFFPYTKKGQRTAYKAKLLDPKRMWIVGDFKEVDLFGWEQAIATGSKKLFITEGEPDALALYQSLKAKSAGTQWADLEPAVVSLQSGSSSATALARLAKEIQAQFKEIVLVFDTDDAGEKAVEAAKQVLPRSTSAKIPGKDANACVIAGKSLALANSVLFQSTAPRNSRLVWASSLVEKARQPAVYGLSWPWKGITDMTRGIRRGETYYLGAGVKMGKSEIVNTLGAHLIKEHKTKVFMAKPEEANDLTLKMVAGKMVGRHFHDPNIPFDHDAFNEALDNWIYPGNEEMLACLELYQHVGWETLRQDIIEAVEAGCKDIFIDPITNLVNGIAAGETDRVLQDIAQDMSALSKDLDFTTYIFCHLKAPLAGPPHERGGAVLSSQFSGSRAMMRSCNMMLGLEGNKDPDLPPEERNIRKLVILEDRAFGESGYVRLYWDKKTGLFKEIEEH